MTVCYLLLMAEWTNKILPWVYRGAGGCTIVLAGLWLGVKIQDRMRHVIPAGTIYAVDDFRNGGLRSLATAIDNAQTSVDILAGQIGSERVLESLVRAHSRGVRVRVLLSGDSNSKKREGALGYLLSRRVGTVYVSEGKFYDQIALIDEDIKLTSSVPWTPGDADMEGSIELVRNGYGGRIITYINKRFTAARLVAP